MTRNFVLLICIFLAGCQSIKYIDKGLSTLQGQPYQYAFNILGFPDSESHIAGKRVFSWEINELRQYLAPNMHTTTIYGGDTSPLHVQTYGPLVQSYNAYCKIDLIVNADDIIEYTKYTGNVGGCQKYDRLLAPKKVKVDIQTLEERDRMFLFSHRKDKNP
ncbi:MAG: hypothetical protein JSC085_000997 [Candidatus Tokpelaia sp. JSC085]|nr:MAG: hypothetical protein JSC085_000997 [Candidatus Tokpelaia sp. JSC085]